MIDPPPLPPLRPRSCTHTIRCDIDILVPLPHVVVQQMARHAVVRLNCDIVHERRNPPVGRHGCRHGALDVRGARRVALDVANGRPGAGGRIAGHRKTPAQRARQDVRRHDVPVARLKRETYGAADAASPTRHKCCWAKHYGAVALDSLGLLCRLRSKVVRESFETLVHLVTNCPAREHEGTDAMYVNGILQ